MSQTVEAYLSTTAFTPFSFCWSSVFLLQPTEENLAKVFATPLPRSCCDFNDFVSRKSTEIDGPRPYYGSYCRIPDCMKIEAWCNARYP